jgi:hypothetical protein
MIEPILLNFQPHGSNKHINVDDIFMRRLRQNSDDNFEFATAHLEVRVVINQYGDLYYTKRLSN